MYGNDSGKRTKGPGEPGPFTNVSRRRPTLPPRLQGSTIGAGGLNFRVRNGTGCLPSAIATETERVREPRGHPDELDSERERSKSSPRPISTGRLNTLPCLHLRPIDLVVCEGPYLVSQWETSSWGELRT